VLYNLKIWKLKKYLTLEEAASLALDIIPQDKKIVDEDYKSMLSVLVEALNMKEFSEDSIKQPPHIDVSIYSHVSYETKIAIPELQKWFAKQNFHSEFFNNNLAESNQTNLSETNYTTKLMKIMNKAIHRYYGENFDHSDKDTHPKQEHIVAWLRAEFSLSQRQAEAIEIIIAPRAGNLP
jgi:hypothetical protein